MMCVDTRSRVSHILLEPWIEQAKERFFRCPQTAMSWPTWFAIPSATTCWVAKYVLTTRTLQTGCCNCSCRHRRNGPIKVIQS
jgi:hypothetical protein